MQTPPSPPGQNAPTQGSAQTDVDLRSVLRGAIMVKCPNVQVSPLHYLCYIWALYICILELYMGSTIYVYYIDIRVPGRCLWSQWRRRSGPLPLPYQCVTACCSYAVLRECGSGCYVIFCVFWRATNIYGLCNSQQWLYPFATVVFGAHI